MEYKQITKVSKNSQQNNSETVTNENDKEIPRRKYLKKGINLQRRDRRLLMI